MSEQAREELRRIRDLATSGKPGTWGKAFLCAPVDIPNSDVRGLACGPCSLGLPTYKAVAWPCPKHVAMMRRWDDLIGDKA